MLLSGYLHSKELFSFLASLSPFILSVYDFLLLRGLGPLQKNIRYFLTKPPLWMFIIGQAMHASYPLKLDEQQDWLVRSIFIISAHCLTVQHFSTQAYDQLHSMI